MKQELVHCCCFWPVSACTDQVTTASESQLTF